MMMADEDARPTTPSSSPMLHGQTGCRPNAPDSSQPSRRQGRWQALLFSMAFVAFCGVIVEACFIYRLHTTLVSCAANTPHEVAVTPKPRVMPEEVGPSKPMAHLTGSGKPAANGHMFWNEGGDFEVHRFKYKDGNLTIEMEGYYFVYSKIYFAENVSVLHSVVRITEYFPKEMVLLQSREYHPKFVKENHCPRTNSYLGGMFHLLEGDVIFVRINNTDVIPSPSAENYFGAYMV